MTLAQLRRDRCGTVAGPRRNSEGDNAFDLRFVGADDGIRTRDPHLGNFIALVSCVSCNLTSDHQLHVCVHTCHMRLTGRRSRLHFVGDFIGIEALGLVPVSCP